MTGILKGIISERRRSGYLGRCFVYLVDIIDGSKD